MNGFELNKIAAAILVAGIIAMVVGNIADILYQPNRKFERGYHIDVTTVSATPASTSAPEEKIDVQALMKKADASLGIKDIKKCSICHTFGKGEPNRVGPNLWGIFGAAKAAKKDFTYSEALSAKGGSWNEEDLVSFTHSPRQFAPGTKMTFAGYRDPQDAANVVAYLKTLR